MLNTFCLIFKKSIICVETNIFYEFIYSDCNPDIIILTKDKDYALLRFNEDIEKYNAYIENVKTNYWKIENYKKPLKSVSSYTIKELIIICEKLNISIIEENNKKKTKNTLYQDIISKIN